MKKFLFFFLLLFLSQTKTAQAKYLIQTDNLDINSNQFPFTQVIKQTTEDDSSNAVIIRGFKESNSKDLFIFSSETDLIDFGIIYPTDPVTRLNHLSIAKPATLRYSILFSQNHELKSDEGETIPDTTCDNGACSEQTEAPWKNILTYGFGYSYPESNNFKQIPNMAKKRAMASFIQGLYNQPSLIDKIEILYKINISGAQKPGVYRNKITYIAVPNF